MSSTTAFELAYSINTNKVFNYLKKKKDIPKGKYSVIN